ncbi:hypothetical protein SAMN02745857_03591 [Andreprevotia lacus DSM 23236]|uniref:Repeat domain-containing protein n=1 Tax=Andreprevotia lacus DSM 23236 TaxID=1121001 RepID=A0A1W1XYQ0_9NEIS|nr:hypothetical protein [Andreprevotia lacus]SMC29089.1 hypothetical protein SAMN02745857_03591 [Andreprevotia lacus DSM 23236]
MRLNQRLMAILLGGLIFTQLAANAAPSNLYLVRNFDTDPNNEFVLEQLNAEDQHYWQQLCRTHGQFWIHGIARAFNCRSQSKGDEAYTHLIIHFQPPRPQQPSSARYSHADSFWGVISTQPLPAQHWQSHMASPEEFARYSSWSRLQGKIRKAELIRRHVTVVETTQPQRKFVILPYVYIHDRGCAPDGEYCDELYYGVFLEHNGKPQRVFTSRTDHLYLLDDLDGDGVPELLQLPSCDGSCAEVVKFYPHAGTLAEWSQ